MQLDPDICELYRRSKLNRYLFACSMSGSFISYEHQLKFSHENRSILDLCAMFRSYLFSFFFG